MPVAGRLQAILLATVVAMCCPLQAAADDAHSAKQLEQQFSDAVLQADAATFDRLLADDFTHTSHTGRFRSKAEWMKDVKPGHSLYTAYAVDKQTIRVFGGTAVVTGRISPQGMNSRGEPIGGKFRYVRVWVKRDGQWKAVAFQGTQIQQEAP